MRDNTPPPHRFFSDAFTHKKILLSREIHLIIMLSRISRRTISHPSLRRHFAKSAVVPSDEVIAQQAHLRPIREIGRRFWRRRFGASGTARKVQGKDSDRSVGQAGRQKGWKTYFGYCVDTNGEW